MGDRPSTSTCAVTAFFAAAGSGLLSTVLWVVVGAADDLDVTTHSGPVAAQALCTSLLGALLAGNYRRLADLQVGMVALGAAQFLVAAWLVALLFSEWDAAARGTNDGFLYLVLGSLWILLVTGQCVFVPAVGAFYGLLLWNRAGRQSRPPRTAWEAHRERLAAQDPDAS